jgi:UTP--glucose-1-phosphate uridylyltransferase
MSQKITKAIIAAAGFGTRFLPQTKAMPKEMLPIIDKPVIQYVVEDLVEAGIKDIIIVTGYAKRNIEDHFDNPNQDLVNNLLEGGPSKKKFIDELKAIANLANFAYVRQKGPYGTATPIANASHLIGNEPFIYTFADDLIVAKKNHFRQMIEIYEKYDCSVLPCIKVSEEEDFKKYGIISGQKIREGLIKIDKIIEKPGKKDAPSDLASVIGYLLKPEVFNYLDSSRKLIKPNQEYFATDYLLEPMIRDGLNLYGLAIQDSIRYDTGNIVSYLKTVIDFALLRPDISDEIRQYLKSKII